MNGCVPGEGEYDFSREHLEASLDPTTRRIDQCYKSLDYYSDAIQKCASLPTRATKANLETAVSLHEEFMGRAVEAIFNSDQSYEEKAMTLRNVWRNNHNRRMEVTNQVLEDMFVQIDGPDETSLLEKFEGAVKSPAEYLPLTIANIKADYTSLLEQEVSFVLGCVSSSTKGRIINSAEIIGEQAFGIAKIGVGVAAGIWLTNYLRGR